MPVEAIEIIESAIQGAPIVEAGYLHGQVLKYALRCWWKNGFEDLQKAKWYLDRLIDLEQRSDSQSLKDFPFGEPSSDHLPKPAFAIDDRVRVCKPGSLLDGKDGEIKDASKEKYCVVSGVAMGWLAPSELQPLEASK